MYDQHIWHISQQCSLGDVDLLVASITPIVFNYLTLDHFLEAILDTSTAMNLFGYVQ